MHFRALITAFLLAAPVLPAAAQDTPAAAPTGPSDFDLAPATIVIFNSRSEESQNLAKYYAQQRRIPERNLIGLECPEAETIGREEYDRTIEIPLRKIMVERKFWELGKVEGQGTIAVKTAVRVLAIIKGVPLRVSEQPVTEKDPKTGKPKTVEIKAGEQNSSSVDSELALSGAVDKSIKGPLRNPYHNQNVSFASFPFTPMFVTGRLDGPDFATAKRLIDDAIAVEQGGGLYGRTAIDLAQKGGAYKEGEDWLLAAAAACESKGLPVVMDTWDVTLPKNWPLRDCALYYGWYTEHADGPFLNPAFRFRRGAVACHIHSFSATTIRTTTGQWCGPLLAKGACGVLGNTWEPYLSLCAHLDVFNDRLLAGYTFGEAASMAMPVLSWMSTALGDPLYRPFPQKIAATAEPEDKDWRGIRLAVARWGGGEEPTLMKNLGDAAANLKSGIIYEYLGLHAQAGGGDAAEKAAPWFEKALGAYSEPADKIRIMLLTADALKRSDSNRAALKMLNKIVTTWPALPETEAAREYIKRWE